jgi:16S rRNA C1402 N4-methylase RsmH
MRMSQVGPSARDLVNGEEEGRLADILYLYGEERASAGIARAIVAARPVDTTLALAEIVASCLPRPKPGEKHRRHGLPGAANRRERRIRELARGLEARNGRWRQAACWRS